MSLKSQLNKSVHCQNNHCPSLSSFNEKHKTTANKLETQFVKINSKNNKNKGFGHSQMVHNNFSRHNSASTTTTTATIDLSASPSIQKNKRNNINNRCLHSPQQSWSMSPNSKNLHEIAYANTCNNKKSKNFEFTEQRCNYERMAQQQQQQQQKLAQEHCELQQQQQHLWPWSSEQHLQCKNVSNSRIPTCSFDKNHNQQPDRQNTQKFNDVIYAKFVALSRFRMQNSKDCFSERHQHLLDSQTTQPTTTTASNSITKSPANKATLTFYNKMPSFELKRWLNDINHDNDANKNLKKPTTKNSLTSSSSLTNIPYAIRQRALRQQLTKDAGLSKATVMGLDKSTALSYHSSKSF